MDNSDRLQERFSVNTGAVAVMRTKIPRLEEYAIDSAKSMYATHDNLTGWVNNPRGNHYQRNGTLKMTRHQFLRMRIAVSLTAQRLIYTRAGYALLSRVRWSWVGLSSSQVPCGERIERMCWHGDMTR